MLKHVLKVLCVMGTLGLMALTALAQARSSSADLVGVVSDPTRAVIKGATITIANSSTGLTRSARTDATGAYRIPLLPPGQYEVKVEVAGYNTQIRKGVLLMVGQTLELDFEMMVGFTREVEVIQTDSPLGDPERTLQAATITQRPINNLPINGRNFLSFVKLTPGVIEENPAIAAQQPAPLTTSGLSFAGQNARTNSVLVDGVDNNDITSNGVRPTIGQEAVREFQINRNNYNPEFGRATGGVINLVSKSGANEFHGDVFNYIRSERLDARNTFASGLAQDPKFKRNQPGFTFGGPIRRDRTFFFVSYEGLYRRESAITTILNDPSILQPTSGQQAVINALLGSADQSVVQLGQGLQALLTTSPNGTAPFNQINYNLITSASGSAFPIEQNANTGGFRLDHAFNERDYLFFRYNLTNDSQHGAGIGGQVAPSAGYDIGSQDHTFTFGETHVFKGGASNELRFQTARNIYNVNTVDPFGPRVQVAGIGLFGREFTGPSNRTQRRLQLVDNFSLRAGNHNMKFGADFSRYTIDTSTSVFLGGLVDFAQLPVALDNVLPPAQIAQLTTALNGVGRSDLNSVITDQPLSLVQQMNFGIARSINQGFGDPRATFTGHILGLYWQDSVRVNSNLQLSYGLRYDYDLLPAGTPRDGNNFGPRFSFAYDPFKTGRTVIRGGAGIYYQPFIVGSAFIATILGGGQISNIFVSADPRLTPIDPNSPCGRALTPDGQPAPPSACFYQSLLGLGFLPGTSTIPEAAYAQLLGLTRQSSSNRVIVRLDGNTVNPYAIQSSIGLDQRFGRDWILSLNYLISRGVKLIRPRQANALPDPTMIDSFGRPALTARIDSTRLADYLNETAGNSTYHGLTVSMNKRFSSFYQVIGSYSFSKAIDDTTDNNFLLAPEDPTNVRNDRGLSAFDVRHVMSMAAVFESPFRSGSGKSLYQRILADIYFSPILTVRSGFPFNPQTGIDINMDNNPNDRPFGVGRNAGIGPGYLTTDVRLGRRFSFSADSPRSLEVSFDTFNIFNRVNFKGVNNNTGGVLFLDQMVGSDTRLTGSSDIPANSFRGFTSAYDPRIVQLGLKLNF